MKLFLDASVLLTVAGSTKGASRALFYSPRLRSHVLLTLDREDFASLLGGQFYGLRVRLPSEFLQEERAAGRLPISPP